MVTEAFFWFLCLCELAAIILLLTALIDKIRQISRFFSETSATGSENLLDAPARIPVELRRPEV